MSKVPRNTWGVIFVHVASIFIQYSTASCTLGDCRQVCPVNSCDMACRAKKSCIQNCGAGGCQKMDCISQGICSQHCRNGCPKMACKASVQCFSECGGNCTMSCTGNGNCSPSCSEDGCKIICKAKQCHVVCSNCEVDFASEQTSGRLLCLKGNCAIKCHEGAKCNINCPSGTCTLTRYQRGTSVAASISSAKLLVLLLDVLSIQLYS